MSVTAEPSHGLRLPAGRVTVLLGPAAVRHAVLDALDPATARRPGGAACGVITVGSGHARSADERLAALRQAAEHRPAAVLVDDIDPVAALSVADGALRAGEDGSLRPEALGAAHNA